MLHAKTVLRKRFLPSPDIQYSIIVCRNRTDVSKEHTAFMLRAENLAKQETGMKHVTAAFRAENGDKMCFLNDGCLLPDYTALYSRR
jgi:hypothetical protein